MNQRRFVILDRDGTIIEERNYLSHPDQVKLIPQAANGLRHLARLGLGLVVVTNQSGIARGFFDLLRLEKIHIRMCELLIAEGVQLDGIYFCPHTDEDNCTCRKPRTGLVDKAVAELQFEPHASFVIGDKPCDINLGHSIGATTLLVRTGYGARIEANHECVADFTVNDLFEAALRIQDCVES